MEEQPAVSSSELKTPSTRKKVALIIAGIIIVIAYLGLNIGIWTYAKKTSKSTSTIVEESAPVSQEEQPIQQGEQASIPIQSESTGGPTPLPTSIPTPTPRPTGPGQYACSSIGTCKDYSDEVRKANCTITYADRACLDQCADVTKRCKL